MAEWKVGRAAFDAQAKALRETNYVYKNAAYDAELVASWAPGGEPVVPSVITDCVAVVDAVD